MNAYELRKAPDLDSLTPVTRPEPQPGARDVIVRVHATSLNHRDLFVARGAAASKAPPIVPLSDGAGEVIAVGPEVKRVRVGDRVAASFFPTWIDGAFHGAYHPAALGGGSTDGMLAERVRLDEAALVKLPDWLTYEEAATLPCAALTAWHALFAAGSLAPGDVVLVQGTGGVSLFALQLAKAAGARVIVTSSSDAKLEKARALGADFGINYRATPAWDEEAKRITGGAGVDHVIEVGGAGTFDRSLTAARFGGTVSLIGVLAGFEGPAKLFTAVFRLLRVHGIYVGSRAMFEDMLRALEATRLRPVIDRVFPFAEARAAYDYLASGAHFGKVVIRLP